MKGQSECGSSLFREVSATELDAIISDAPHTKVESYRLLTGGLFNTTYLVDTTEHGRIVLRIGPVNRHLLMPFEHRLMEAEQQVYALCSKRGIPVSEVLALDISKKIIDRDYMIVRYIPSQPMNEAKLMPEEQAQICREIGKATARMHEITAPRFGRIVDVSEGKGFSKWSDCLLDELQQWESVAAAIDLFTEKDRMQVREIFGQALPYLNEIKTPCLVHTDLWFGNVLVRNNGASQEFAAIIDADRALWGDPEFEFSAIGWMQNDEHFWEGYGRRLSADNPGLIRRGIYRLLSRLWNSYVFMREYNEPETAYEQRAEAYEQMEELQQLLRMSRN
ncbi:MAG: phosphotransferase [Roseburia sp.]|nr:phosphotransferase [Roseburia sp.]